MDEILKEARDRKAKFYSDRKSIFDKELIVEMPMKLPVDKYFYIEAKYTKDEK